MASLESNATNYVGLTGIVLVEMSGDRCVGRLEIETKHHQPYGVVHGGVYCTLAETVASTGAAMWAMEQGMAGAVGVTNKTDFLRATTQGALVAEATPIHRGRSQQLWQVNIIRESDGKLAAQAQVRLHNVSNTDF
jgi:uncharacterized protein (TIGR00369 family)